MNTIQLLLFLLILYLASYEVTIEGFVKFDDTLIDKDDLKFIPSSDKHSNHLLNNYIIRPKKIISHDDGFISSLMDITGENNYRYLFEFPTDNPNIDLDIQKDFTSMLDRPIITDDNNVVKNLKKERLKDQRLVNDPDFMNRHPKRIANKIIKYLPGIEDEIYEKNHPLSHAVDIHLQTCGDDGYGNRYRCPTGSKYIHKHKDFPSNHSDSSSNALCCGPF